MENQLIKQKALRIALDNYLSSWNIEDINNILEQMDENSAKVDLWEPFEHYEQSEVGEMIDILSKDIYNTFKVKELK